MHQLISQKVEVHIHMWTPHLKKWGSIDPLDLVALQPLVQPTYQI